MNKRQIIIAIFMSVLAMTPLQASTQDSYQERLLFSPGLETLQAEARGRIMIYDGLKNKTVEKALDHQFDRIENMMFVRTVYVQENGELEVEDDCD
ncbi:MAG: hypothetical protein OEU50_16095 [Gammaproteobacteria bacterium]|nr:hypothetical protein [Gammaproteobacteria bacterium]